MFDGQITFISVADLEASTAFYAGPLGLPMVLDQGRCRIFRTAGKAYVGICTNRPPDPGAVILTLVTEDVDAAYARLIDAGARIDVAPRHNEEYGIYQLFARDPDGYVIEVQRFDDAGWAEPD